MHSQYPLPNAQNGYLGEHIACMQRSLRHWTGRDLIEAGCPAHRLPERVFHSQWVVVSHGPGTDPRFNYANQTALRLWEMTWETFVGLPSRQSAEPAQQSVRAEVLAKVARDGFVDDYSGVRTSSSGRRFVIEGVTLWNLIDADLKPCGQAAMFQHWRYLPDGT